MPHGATWAFVMTPHLGGIYSVYRALREGLSRHGIGLRWVGVGPAAARGVRQPAWAHELEHGTVVAPEEGLTDAAAGAALVRHLSAGGYAGVFVNSLMAPVEMNAPRYLPREVRRIVIAHNITPATYNAAVALRHDVDGAVGVSPRVAEDLVRRGFPPETTVAIPNAFDTAPYAGLARPPRQGPSFRLLSLGRVEDIAKGVLWLPEIMRRLAPLDVTLTVAGDGPDLAELRRRCAGPGLAERVTFLGPVPGSDVPALCARHDVLVMPSRFEGFGYTLIEAMGGGCVPVASKIRGVTDYIVEDGLTGLLFPVGDLAAAAGRIGELARDPARFEAVSAAARQAALSRFGVGPMGDAYAKLIRQVESSPPRTREPLPVERWKYPAGFGAGVRRFVPAWAKNALRAWLAR